MTISSTTSVIQYQGNGTTENFSFPYIFFAPGDLVVTLYDTTANANVVPAPVLNGSGVYDYTVTGVQDAATGEYLSGAFVNFNNAPLGNHRVVIQRLLAATQNLDLVDNAKFPASPINAEFDRLTMLCQQLGDGLARTIQTPPTDQPGVLVLPPAAVRANKFLAFDVSGNPIVLAGPNPTPGTVGGMAGLVTADNTLVDTALYNYAPVKNQTGSAIHLLLKTSPGDGDELTVVDALGNCTLALPIIVSGNGKTIGFDTTYQLNFPGQSVKVKYSQSDGKWLATPG